MLVLFDLQDVLDYGILGVFVGRKGVDACGSSHSLTVVEVDGVRTLLVSNRSSGDCGLRIDLSKFNLIEGDHLIVTGRLSGSAPSRGWALQLLKYNLNCSHCEEGELARNVFPKLGEVFSLSCLLDESDMNKEIHIQSRTWIKGMEHADFFIDSIVIIRTDKNSSLLDSRKVVYTMEADAYLKEMDGGGYTEYLFSTGGPRYTVNITPGSRNIHMGNRQNDWDGLDLRTSLLGLQRGSPYKIRVKGKVDGVAPEGSEMMLQLLPNYDWRCNTRVKDNDEFILEHKFSETEIETLTSVRIATNMEGKTMDFSIYAIELVVDNLDECLR